MVPALARFTAVFFFEGRERSSEEAPRLWWRAMSPLRPISASMTIAVAGFSAALVFAAGVVIAERVEPRSGAAPLAATPLPKLAPPVDESARAATSAPIASVVPPPIASVAPPPIASAAVDSGDPAGLSADRGYLVLQGAVDGRAYVNGAEVGPSEQRIAVPCGARYVRIGTAAAPGRPTAWLTKGRSVVVACRGETRIDLAR